MITAADMTIDDSAAYGARATSSASQARVTFGDGSSRPFDDDDWRAGWGPYATRGAGSSPRPACPGDCQPDGIPTPSGGPQGEEIQ